ncbi:MAG: hypothetical protein ACREXU_04805, partial [Gammaproteobacteria bacterium]
SSALPGTMPSPYALAHRALAEDGVRRCGPGGRAALRARVGEGGAGGLEIIQPASPHAQPRPARSGLQALDLSRDQLLPNEQPERRYPWGPYPDPNRANYAATGIGTTSALGIFPGGASPLALRR